MAPFAAPTPSALPDLRAELDAHRAAGRVARFWWRDDDAVEPTPALDRLLRITAEHGAPLGLAVIPARATAALADSLAGESGVRILQHGWSHTDHAPPGAKKRELGDERPASAVADELSVGRARLATLFDRRFVPALVPPWNRIAPDVARALPALGYTGLSTHAAQRFDVAGLAEANTHIDPVDWRGGGGVAAEDAALGPGMKRLRLNREGVADAKSDEGAAIGLLTHHLVMDEATWALTAAVARLVTEHPAAVWADPVDLLTPGEMG